MNDSRTQPAFTLVEVMVVIAVMAVAVGLGGGMYMGSYHHMQVEKAARQLVCAIRYGRMLALERQGDVRLCLDSQQGRFFLIAPQRDKQGQYQTTAVTDQLGKPVELNESIRLEAVDIKTNVSGQDEGSFISADRCVTFRPDGSADEALIQIGDGKRHYSISICPITARATLTEGTVADVISTTIDLDVDS